MTQGQADQEEVKPFGGHEEGKYYWCGYWMRYYKVTKIFTDNGQWYVRSLWEDGHSTTHFTALNPAKDREAKQQEFEFACLERRRLGMQSAI